MKTIYSIPHPYTDRQIEVYGEPEMGWYEWRFIVDGRVEIDSRDAGYGIPEIALRDALIEATK